MRRGQHELAAEGSREGGKGVANHLHAEQDTRYGRFTIPCRLTGHGRITGLRVSKNTLRS